MARKEQEQPRSVRISKSLSWLLRHGAAKERIAMSAAGYVNLADMLAWPKLRGMGASFQEIVECVRGNEKQRFGLRWDAADATDSEADSEARKEGETPHLRALARIEASERPDPAEYSIRAVQGHSLSSVDATSLLQRITLETAPEVCVHGTFFASWPLILKSGGLKAGTRNHVHFATGPVLADVLPLEEGLEGSDQGGRQKVQGQDSAVLKQAMQKSEVVSGMRGDAQVLIYVDIKRSMENGKMEWWRSDNGVILSEGTIAGESTPPSELEETEIMLEETSVNGATAASKSNTKARRRSQQPTNRLQQKLVPTEYWDIVVGIGIGVLWQRGRGVVQEVPANIMRSARGKYHGQGSNGKSQPNNKARGNDKPRIKIERGDLEGFD